MTARGRGRPRLDAGRPETREVIVTAARELFAERGYERATMRAIASRAGVDAALISHYFGNKEALAVDALRPTADPATTFGALAEHRTRLGAEFVTRALRIWEDDPAQRERAIALLRIAVVNERVAERMRAFYLGLARGALGEFITDDDGRDLRLTLIASHVLGIVMARYVIRLPDVAAADVVELAERAGPVVDHYLGRVSGSYPGSGSGSADIADRARPV